MQTRQRQSSNTHKHARTHASSLQDESDEQRWPFDYVVAGARARKVHYMCVYLRYSLMSVAGVLCAPRDKQTARCDQHSSAVTGLVQDSTVQYGSGVAGVTILVILTSGVPRDVPCASCHVRSESRNREAIEFLCSRGDGNMRGTDAAEAARGIRKLPNERGEHPARLDPFIYTIHCPTL